MNEIEKAASDASVELARRVKDKCIEHGETRGMSFKRGKKYVIVGGWSVKGGLFFWYFENTQEAFDDFIGQFRDLVDCEPPQ
jgi:hypothetical protein